VDEMPNRVRKQIGQGEHNFAGVVRAEQDDAEDECG
jgi:hypothetical protein